MTAVDLSNNALAGIFDYLSHTGKIVKVAYPKQGRSIYNSQSVEEHSRLEALAYTRITWLIVDEDECRRALAPFFSSPNLHNNIHDNPLAYCHEMRERWLNQYKWGIPSKSGTRILDLTPEYISGERPESTVDYLIPFLPFIQNGVELTRLPDRDLSYIENAQPMSVFQGNVVGKHNVDLLKGRYRRAYLSISASASPEVALTMRLPEYHKSTPKSRSRPRPGHGSPSTLPGPASAYYSPLTQAGSLADGEGGAPSSSSNRMAVATRSFPLPEPKYFVSRTASLGDTPPPQGVWPGSTTSAEAVMHTADTMPLPPHATPYHRFLNLISALEWFGLIAVKRVSKGEEQMLAFKILNEVVCGQVFQLFHPSPIPQRERDWPQYLDDLRRFWLYGLRFMIYNTPKVFVQHDGQQISTPPFYDAVGGPVIDAFYFHIYESRPCALIVPLPPFIRNGVVFLACDDIRFFQKLQMPIQDPNFNISQQAQHDFLLAYAMPEGLPHVEPQYRETISEEEVPICEQLLNF